LIGVLVVSAVVVVMIAVFAWFYFYSRTLAWGQSDTRKALLNLMVVVGPIFGNHYRREPPEVPSVSAPGPDDDDDRPARISPPASTE
jgi:hypothetical protein